jgi:hypothetical protein
VADQPSDSIHKTPWHQDPSFLTGLVAVGFLLVISFAGLWMMEKGKANRLAQELDAARQTLHMIQQQQAPNASQNPSRFDPRTIEMLKGMMADPTTEMPEEISLPQTP